MSSDQDESNGEIPDDPRTNDDGQADAFNDNEGNDNGDAGITAEEEEEGQRQRQQQQQQQQLRRQKDDELEIPLLALDPASVLSKESGQNYFSEAPPPSPEKTRRQRPTRRTTRPDNNADARAFVSEDVSRRSGIELEVEELLDNSSQWRKAFQPRIRTPVRRAVLSYGGVSPGRRQQVLCDLNAKVRELDVASLSRGIACSLKATGGQQQPRHQQLPGGGQEDSASAVRVIGSASKLDPRVRIAYQHMKPRQSKEPPSPSRHDSQSSWHNAGRLQSRGHTVLSRATIHSRDAGAAEARTAGTAADSGSRPPRRVKTSLTTLTAPLAASSYWSNCVTKADLLRLQTINGEVQRSLYTERTPGLRRLLHAGGGDTSVLGDLCGSSLQTVPLASLLAGGREKSSPAGFPHARQLQQRV